MITISLLIFNRNAAVANINETVIEADSNVNHDINSNNPTAIDEVQNQDEITITADQLTYDGEGLLNAVGSVKLTSSDGITITAEQLTYCDTTGLAVASGGVEIIQKQDVYQSETLEYNLKTHQGFSESATCLLDSKGAKDMKLTGRNMEITDETVKMKNNVFTRCHRPTPEYFITATRIVYQGDRVKLWNSIIFIHGIPIFYFPYLSFKVGANKIPNLKPGYNDEDGLFVTYSFETPVENGHNWFFNGYYSTKSTSTYGAGLGLYKNNLNNQISVNYTNDQLADNKYWTVADTISYSMPLCYLIINGSYRFDDSERTQYGFNLYGNYWRSPVGNWQVGILAQEITALSDSDRYGGVYGGYRLNYSLNRYLAFNFLRIDPLSTLPEGDFESLLSDYNYRFGSNYMYNIRVPFWKDYYFDLDGSYNSTQDLWIDRNYRITRDTCCFTLSFGWDDITETMTFSWSISL